MRKQGEKPIIYCFGEKPSKLSQENRKENLICNKVEIGTMAIKSTIVHTKDLSMTIKFQKIQLVFAFFVCSFTRMITFLFWLL